MTFNDADFNKKTCISWYRFCFYIGNNFLYQLGGELIMTIIMFFKKFIFLFGVKKAFRFRKAFKYFLKYKYTSLSVLLNSNDNNRNDINNLFVHNVDTNINKYFNYTSFCTKNNYWSDIFYGFHFLKIIATI